MMLMFKSMYVHYSGVMRVITLSIAATTLISCAMLESEHDGPRAKLIFSAPQLDESLSQDVVPSLHLLESNDDCSFSSLGGIRLPIGSKRGDSYVPAEQRVFVNVQPADDTSRKIDIDQGVSFSFVPEVDREYLIEHLGSPSNFRIKYYVIEDDGTNTEIKVQGLECN